MSSSPRPCNGYSTLKPPPDGDGTTPPPKKRYWLRFILASLIIVAVAAAATASSILLYIDSIAHALGGKNDALHHKIESEITEVDGGEPQTILILGSDVRAGTEEERGRSDTTILLRLDNDKNMISVMSIPRDLKTEIPGIGTTKFNAGYEVGGPKLTIHVVKELTGLNINHFINIDFLGFVRAVDAIGCVYTDVDRRYYHSNVGVTPGSEEEYSEINIKPGYQKLCGKKALQYVRYRHTDTDIVRSARQQSFLSQVRHQVSPTDLITDDHNLIDILTEYTSSDIKDGTELLTLLDLLYELRGGEVNQVHFPAELGPSYVYSSEAEIHHAVKEFLGEAGYESRMHSEEPRTEKTSEQKQKKTGDGTHSTRHAKKHVPAGGDELVPATDVGEAEAKMVLNHVGGGFPVFYPTRLPYGAAFQESNPYEKIVDPRVYHMRDQDKERHGAYRMVGVYGPEYELKYFGIQGIQGWEDPPVLDNPTEERTVNGRDYSIYADSGRVNLVAWHRGESTYWISNSLQQSLSNEQMMGIAESCHAILAKRGLPGTGASAKR